jgi:peptidoglycan/LPS O-acetylase OafA/YrhL
MILGLSARIMCRNLFDGTLFYTSIIVLYSQAVLGLWVFFVLSKISVLFAKVNKVVEYFDNLSFELYIVHYMFFVGPFRVMSLTQSFILNSIMALILSFISAVILNYTCKNMYSLINNKTIHT